MSKLPIAYHLVGGYSVSNVCAKNRNYRYCIQADSPRPMSAEMIFFSKYGIGKSRQTPYILHSEFVPIQR